MALLTLRQQLGKALEEIATHIAHIARTHAHFHMHSFGSVIRVLVGIFCAFVPRVLATIAFSTLVYSQISVGKHLQIACGRHSASCGVGDDKRRSISINVILYRRFLCCCCCCAESSGSHKSLHPGWPAVWPMPMEYLNIHTETPSASEKCHIETEYLKRVFVDSNSK